MNSQDFIMSLSKFWGFSLRKEFRDFLENKIKHWTPNKLEWALTKLKLTMPYNWQIRIQTILDLGETYDQMIAENKNWQIREEKEDKIVVDVSNDFVKEQLKKIKELLQ